MIGILCVAIIAGLIFLTGSKSKIISKVSFGIYAGLTYIFYGIFILVFALGCIGMIAYWLGLIG